jgi:hypothetical protein
VKVELSSNTSDERCPTPDSNLSWGTDYPDGGVLWFSTVPLSKCQDIP